MRTIICDFDLIVLLPLAIVAFVSLCISVRLHYVTRWQGASEARRELRLAIQAPTVGLAILIAFIFFTGHLKLEIIWLVWQLLSLVAFILFAAGLGASCYYAYKRLWLKFAIALAIMLVSSAGIEHFFHQKANTMRIVCPSCSDDDEDPNPPEY